MITYELQVSTGLTSSGCLTPVLEVRSQEVEFLVEGHHVLLDLFHGALALGVHVGFALALPVVRVQTHRSIEVGDLMGVLTRRRHLDRARPVEVEVTQGERQVLDVQLAEAGLVLRHVEVGREHAALGGVGRREVEVEDAGGAARGFVGLAVLLD